MSDPSPTFDLARFLKLVESSGHPGALGMRMIDRGDDWCEFAIDQRPDFMIDEEDGILASGPIIALVDMATGAAIWIKQGRFRPNATIDLRVDYLRRAAPGRTIVARGECYRLTRRIAFVRGIAHDGDPADPIAHVAGTFMFTDAD